MITSGAMIGLCQRGRRCRSSWERLVAQVTFAGLRPFLLPEWRRYLKREAPYRQWLEANRLSPAGLADLRDCLAGQESRLPTISVVMPVYRPGLGHFRQAVASVMDQVYPRWELCLCDDGSADPQLTSELRALEEADPRVRIVHGSDNRGIAAATNAAAGLATGDVLLFLDQDDLLEPDCLAEFALAFAVRPDLDLAYSDSDKIDAAGWRHAPSFKPGWSPWLLLSYMYLSHAVAVRRDLFERLGGFRSDFDGSQDYDLLLRVSEVARNIQHIPRVLYHWRVTAGSTALRADEKPGSVSAGQEAVTQAVARRKIAAQVGRPAWAERAGIGLFELRPTGPLPEITLVVLPDGKLGPDGRWLSAIRAALPQRVNMVVASGDDNLGRQAAEACAQASGGVVVFLQAGFVPCQPGWLDRLASLARASRGVVGPRVINDVGQVIAAGLVRPHGESSYRAGFAGQPGHRPGVLYLAGILRECAAVPGFCVAMPRQFACEALGHAAEIDDAVGLGVYFSERARAAGRPVLVVAHCDLAAPRGFETPASAPATLPDPWYNRNLGQGDRQFVPRPVSPEVRQEQPVRLAVVTHNLNREGAQSTLLDLLQGLKARGYADPLVVSSAYGELVDSLADLGIPLHIVPRPGRRAAAADNAAYRSALADVFRRAGAQAVLANTLDSYAAVNAAEMSGLRAIWWQHEGGSWRHHFRRLRLGERAMAFAAFGQSYRVVQVAQATRTSWLPVATRDNFEVVRYGLRPEQLGAELSRWSRPAARTALGLADDTVCILLLGSVSARKAQADVIAAIRFLPGHQVKKLRIMIAGAFVEPSYLARLKQMVARLPMSQEHVISLCGSVPDAALYFAAADMFACCSRRESAPRAIVEAMAFGLPVVTTPVDGIPELVDEGGTGLFYTPGRPRELAARIAQLANDAGLRRRLGDGGRQRAAAIIDYDGMVARFGTMVREAAWQGGRAVDLD